MSTQGISVVHAIPGRIRLRVAQLRENPVLAREVQARLAAVPGLRQVETNPLTGSVLILYDTQEGAAADSLRALAEPFVQLFPESKIPDLEAAVAPSANGSGEEPALGQGIAAFFGTLNTGVDTLTGGSTDLKILLPLILFVLGLRSLLTSEKLVFPTWYDLFWFSLGTYFMMHPRRPEKGQ